MDLTALSTFPVYARSLRWLPERASPLLSLRERPSFLRRDVKVTSPRTLCTSILDPSSNTRFRPPPFSSTPTTQLQNRRAANDTVANVRHSSLL
jgi:hypothetical protein